MKYKKIFIEPKEDLNYKFMLPDFYKAALSSGALLIASNSGNLMKGLDL